MTVVAAALLDGEGRILLQQRAPGRAMAGLWEFPGGKVEQGELPETALARELEEELGIAIAPADFAPACFASAPVANTRACSGRCANPRANAPAGCPTSIRRR